MNTSTFRALRGKSAISLAAALSLSLAGQAGAAVNIGNLQSEYGLGVPVNTTIQASAWFKAGFGLAGWSMFSKWGVINLRKGNYELTATTDVVGLHPGVSVWYRSTGRKFAPLNFVTGHSYFQDVSIMGSNQIDESTGQNLGTIKMDLMVNGYDADGMVGSQGSTAGAAWPSRPSLGPVSDGVPGQLVLKFKVRKRGWYQFVVGGINPNDKTATLGGFDNNATYHPVSVRIDRK